jgi:hypothetical protein
VAALLVTVLMVSAADRSAMAAELSESDVTLVHDHVGLPVPAPGTLEEKVVELLESCSVDSTSYAQPERLWKRATEAASFVHVRFANPREVRAAAATGGSDNLSNVREILLALPAASCPDHVLVKAEGTTLSFTKYSPRVLQALIGALGPAFSTLCPM